MAAVQHFQKSLALKDTPEVRQTTPDEANQPDVQAFGCSGFTVPVLLLAETVQTKI